MRENRGGNRLTTLARLNRYLEESNSRPASASYGRNPPGEQLQTLGFQFLNEELPPLRENVLVASTHASTTPSRYSGMNSSSFFPLQRLNRRDDEMMRAACS